MKSPNENAPEDPQKTILQVPCCDFWSLSNDWWLKEIKNETGKQRRVAERALSNYIKVSVADLDELKMIYPKENTFRFSFLAIFLLT